MKKLIYSCLCALLLLTQACKHKKANTNSTPKAIPTVSVVQPTIGTIQEIKQLNGQVVYFNKTTITAPITGYITNVKAAMGDKMYKGKLLFYIQTKESRALQNAKASTPKGFGIIPIYANTSGFINSLSINEPGVFISEGNTMATIIKNTDLVIQVNVPFEFSSKLDPKTTVNIELPNKNVLVASYYKTLPTVDPVSQTQQILFKLNKFTPLPENLNVVVTFTSTNKNNSTNLPKDVVLTNETQDEFWIMKVNKDSMALKVPILKGIENNDKVEVLSPALSTSDKIIQKGAYGLPDSTKVKIN